MSYVEIDPILYAWARENGLYVSTHYRDEEVRSVPIVDDAGDEYQLWLTRPDALGELTVSVSDNRGKLSEVRTRTDDLETALKKAMSAVNRWIAEAGHTRTPVLRNRVRPSEES